jgi:hypothetical protein
MFVLAVLLGATSAQAAGEDAPEADVSATGKDGSDDGAGEQNLSHLFTVGVRASILGGYRMVLRYDDSPFCSEPDFTKSLDDQQQFCGHLGPAMVDLALSFAPLPSLEPFVMARLGLAQEAQTDTRPLRILAIGARIYTRPKKAFKFYVEPSLGVEMERGVGSPEWTYNGSFDPQYPTDVIFRAAMGPQFDFSRNVGAYVQVFGMSVGVLRYIHATMEFGAGVQARFP